MADKKRIIVDEFTGDGNDLVNCYFKAKNDGTYDFYDKDDHSKATGLTLDNPSGEFHLPGDPDDLWTVTLSIASLNGNWTRKSKTAQDGQDGGTFQAQAGGGGGMEEELEAAAQTAQNIMIKKITSKNGTGFGDELLNCSFELAGDSGRYKFKDPDGGVLHEDVTWADRFHFNYMSQKWEIISNIHTIEGKAHGDWSLLEGDGEEVDGGTFQAQAGGGGGVDENAYAAKA